MHVKGLGVQTREEPTALLEPLGRSTEFDVIVAEKRGYLLLKRIFDIIFSVSSIVCFAPLLVAIAVAIRLDSRGPAVFKQRRVGKNGKCFTFYKFRSMYNDAERRRREMQHLNEVSGPVFKVRNDPRITRVGHILRRLSLDELPQLFNVLKGDMSIVGPRPPLPEEVELYEPWHLRRLAVTPGITCFWQVQGRSKIGFDDWVRMDLEYIARRSLLLDMHIILKTVPAVFSGDGAY